MDQSRHLHTCSTFLISTVENKLVGHNLDDYIEVPGLVIANPRQVAKENISWQDLKSFRSRSRPRLQWVSQYGSITCNTFGKEFPDGGLNEAGLYIGEMTLFGTKYPLGEGLPKIYHHQWMQYILDNFETVEQVLASLSKVVIDGHCQWHFFIADKQGNAASIEFSSGETSIHTGDQMPVRVLCNSAYAQEITHLHDYEGFGGTKPVDFGNHEGAERFVQAATMLQRYEANPQQPAADKAFAILKQLECGNTKWSTVYDLNRMRIYFRTYRAGEIKYVDFSTFNLTGQAPAMLLDIHCPGSGDVSGGFQVFSNARNHSAIAETWAGIDFRKPMLNKFFKPWLVTKLSNYPKKFSVQKDLVS